MTKLEEKFPEFFGNPYCGVFYPEYWEDMLMCLCGAIKDRMAQNSLPPECMQVRQVKSKFGGLRFYYDFDGPDDVRAYIRGAVDMAEGASFEVNA